MDSPGAIADQHADRAVGHLARPRAVALADLVQQRRAARLGQQLAAIADQAARRDDELHPHATVGVGRHLLHPALRVGERLADRADEVGRDVDRDPLVRLVDLAVDLAQQHLRPRDLHLEALAAHLLDEHGQLQLAAAAHLERVGRRRSAGPRSRRCPAPRARGASLIWRLVTSLPSRPDERRGVHAERHRQRRLVDVEPRQRPRIGRIGDRVADRHLGQAGDGDDLARPGLR